MQYKGSDFPQYRKLNNEKAFYKIVDDRHFDEIQRIGSRILRYSFHAEKYPEILRIQDMLDFSDGYLLSNEEEFNALLNDQTL